ncbi:MAG: hypothetical protein ACOZIN_08570 [Myxococcota bacterium]
MLLWETTTKMKSAPLGFGIATAQAQGGVQSASAAAPLSAVVGSLQLVQRPQSAAAEGAAHKEQEGGDWWPWALGGAAVLAVGAVVLVVVGSR